VLVQASVKWEAVGVFRERSPNTSNTLKVFKRLPCFTDEVAARDGPAYVRCCLVGWLLQSM